MKLPWESVIDTVGDLIGKVIPDPAAKAAAILQLETLKQTGALEADRIKLSAILAEAQSSDPWTSRARPSFMYVMYILILFCIPMGLVSAFSAEVGARIADGMNAYLKAIPEQLYNLFMVVALGYIGGRTVEKVKGSA